MPSCAPLDLPCLQVEQLQAQLQAQEEELQQLRQRDEQVQQQVHHMGSALQIEVSAAMG